jgi:hypothetical protein
MERAGRFRVMIFSFYFYDLEYLGIKSNRMEWNQMIKDDIFLAFYMLIILCEWELNPCIFSRLPDEHFLTWLALSSPLYIKSMSNTERAVNIESRPLPAIRDGNLDGWFVYISYMAAAGNAVSLQLGSPCHGRRYDTARHGPSIMLYWVTHLQPGRRSAVLDQPSSFRPHWSNNLSYTKINISTVQNRMYIGTVHQYYRQLGNF